MTADRSLRRAFKCSARSSLMALASEGMAPSAMAIRPEADYIL